MSSAFYNSIWHTTQKELDTLAIIDYENQAQDPQFDRTQAQHATFELYIKYITISNRLEEVYDKITQPQKRLLVRKLLDCCLGRVIELKHDLVNIDMMEFSYNDAVIEKLKLTPLDAEIRIPRYFKREREKEIKERKQFIDDVLIKLGWLDENPPEEKPTEIEAIKLIQIHERARQGRLRAHFMKEIKMLKDKGKPDVRKSGSGLLAAMKIQKMWRGHAARRRTRRRKMEEMILIGMIPPPVNNQKKSEEIEKMNQTILERYKLQEEYKEKFENALTETKEEIKNKQGSVLMEDIADDIRAWIREQNEKMGKLPDFPSEDHGGSRHLFSRQGTESEISRSSAISSKESRKTKDKSKSPAKSGDLNIEDNLEGGFRPTQSAFLPDIKAAVDEFNDIWRDKEESSNLRQTHYDDMVYADKYNEVESEIRKVVDDLMRQELEQLQAAMDRDRATKGKKAKKSSKTRRSGKKGKKKKEKDLTPDRTTESLFEELITNGIIRKYPETPLSSYLGDKAYAERDGINPAPGDIKQVLAEYCILPLGSDTLRNYCPCIRSLLLTGPTGTGKRTLLHAICTEAGAVLFDITPANIVGKYPGKSGLIMLIHLILKVSRLLQPSVIYMGDAERPFMKKIPKTDRTDPKRLKKDLPKIVKNIAPEDRVIFIGTSQMPWEADQKILQQTFNRFIYIPRPDYGALSYAWKELIKRKVTNQEQYNCLVGLMKSNPDMAKGFNTEAPSEVLSFWEKASVQLNSLDPPDRTGKEWRNEYTGGYSNFDYSVIAKISDGYTIGSVVSCVQEVMTCKRKLQLRTLPLTHVEFINSLCKRDPVYREEEEAFTLWWAKTPLGRRRQRAIEMEEEARLESQNTNGKAKKKA